MNIDTQDLPSYIAGYDNYIDDTRPVYSTREYNDMKEELESKIEDKEDEIYEQEEEIERLKSIIKEVREYIRSQKLHKFQDTTGGLTYEERKLLEILDKGE